MKISTKILSLLALFLIVGIVTALVIQYTATRQPNRGVAIEELTQLFQPEIKPLGIVTFKAYREFRGNAVRWSAVYFGCLFGSALLSALAALILKLELLANRPHLRNDLSATLATFAALLVTLSTTGNFQQKWQANRIAAAEMENLTYELSRSTASTDIDAILSHIQKINSKRNRAIVGDLAEMATNNPLATAPTGGPKAVEQQDAPPKP